MQTSREQHQKGQTLLQAVKQYIKLDELKRGREFKFDWSTRPCFVRGVDYAIVSVSKLSAVSLDPRRRKNQVQIDDV